MTLEIDTDTVIRAIRPSARYGYRIKNGVTTIDYPEGVEPIEQSVFDAKMVELEAEWDTNQYQRDRASAFPSIGDQLDMQYHDQLDGTTTWEDAIAKVKADNPKPE